MKSNQPSNIKQPVKPTKSSNLFLVVGIGASAGGLDAFKKLLKAIPDDSGMAYVLVQHLDPSHESMLPELLQKVTTIPVLEITDDIKVEPNHIYVLPSNKMMVATDGVLLLNPRPTKSKTDRNLPIDLFFTSLAEVHQSHAIGVVLSGTGSDGTTGLKIIKDHGGITFAQDEASASYDGMPHSAVQANVVDFILPPEKIPAKLQEISLNIDKSDDELQNLPQHEEDVFKQILSLLRIRKGTDFTYYKQTTVRRRILRRMAISKNEDPIRYLKYLRENKSEQDVLYQDLLIPVTSFFRDSATFDHLCETVFPLIVKNKMPGEIIRVWVAGCSTGEEAYSIAMCFKEFLEDKHRVQIFATDLSEPAITKARTGIYSKREVESVLPQQLQEFFTKINGSYQVNKSIRDMCVFAIHNFLKDPPFGKMDFISCRNVLIYLEPYLQKKALTTFHYSLTPKGFLLLGKTETISGVPDLFSSASISNSHKLFTRKDVAGKFMHVATQRSENNLSPIEPNANKETIRTDFQKTADEIMLRQYTPAGVVVNEAMDIVHFRGKTGNYLEQSPGKPSHNLLQMARNGLAFELRNILHKAKKQKGTATKENIPLEVNGSLHNISIEALPLPNTIEPHYLILFHEQKDVRNQKSEVGRKKTGSSSKTKSDDKDLRILQLEKELAQTREDMRSITEDQEAANEELQSANEELLSSSEELQSLNEELETGKEELQSTNEELMVVNHEITGLNEQVTEARDYAEAIVSNIREPLLVLDKNLRVRTANNAFYKTFQVIELETEGVLIYNLGNKQWNIPALKSLLENILPEKSKFNDFEVTHNFSSIGERTMLLNAREVINKSNSEKLILLSIEDITERKKAVDIIRKSEEQFHTMAELMPQKISSADADGHIFYYNKKWLDFTGLRADELKARGFSQVLHPDEQQEVEKRWKNSVETGNGFEMELRLRNKEGEYKWHLSRVAAVKDDIGKIISWIGAATEIQEQIEQRESLEKAVAKRTQDLQTANEELKRINKELEAFAYVSSHDLQEPLRKILMFSGRILENENEKLSELGKRDFNFMKDAAGRMQKLIEDLLTFSRLSTAERKFESTDLGIIIDKVKEEFRDVIEESHAIIEANDLCMVNIIPFQFHQLMQNLIGNALKFSKPGQPPHIIIKSVIIKGSTLKDQKFVLSAEMLEAISPNADYCHITIADNGIGFENEFREKIFEVFQKLHSKDEYAGTGIGLAIVKKIVENHYGIITATSKLNKGTEFNIYMPVYKNRDSHHAKRIS